MLTTVPPETTLPAYGTASQNRVAMHGGLGADEFQPATTEISLPEQQATVVKMMYDEMMIGGLSPEPRMSKIKRRISMIGRKFGL